MWNFLSSIINKITAFITGLAMLFSPVASIPQNNIAFGAANTKIRQEINITDAYLYSASSAYATSSEIVAITDTNYTGPMYYLEVVASTTAATTASFSLVNATSSRTAVSVTLTGGSTSYGVFRSAAFLPNSSSTVEYKVRANNETVGKGLIASRIIVLQNSGSGDLNTTETQIEIGSATTTANNTTTLPLQNPKYWYYDSNKWDGPLTFYVDVTYQDTQVSSSTTYNTPGTYTHTLTNGISYLYIRAIGAGGGGGDTAATTGGAGGGGGAYAEGVFATTTGMGTFIVGAGGTSGSSAVAASSTYNYKVGGTSANMVDARGGKGGGTVETPGGDGGLASLSTGNTVTRDGGNGGIGNTSCDCGGGGGGGASFNGIGAVGENGNTSAGLGGLGGTGGGGSGAGGARGNGGNGGVSGSNGGGGGGDDNFTGGRGNFGSGGGGGNTGTTNTGGDGQIFLIETHGKVGIALEESDGTGDGFTGWAFKTMVVTNGEATSTPTRVRSSEFTPISGRNYRIVASTTNSTASYNIYNAKIVVEQKPRTYYFNASDAGPTDPNTVWNDDANGFDGNTGTITTTATTGSVSTNFILGEGTNAPTSGGTITQVRFRNFDFSADFVLTINVYTDGLGELLGTGSYGGASGYSAYTTLSTPSGGWTWQKINDLEIKAFATDTTAIARFSRVEIEVTTSISKTQPQYLLAPFKLPTGTALQNFLTKWDSSEWSTTNAYVAQSEAANGSASVTGIYDTANTLITNSTISTIDNRATSSPICLSEELSAENFDTKATTNNGDIYAVRILVDVGSSETPSCGAPAPSNAVLQSEFFFE